MSLFRLTYASVARAGLAQDELLAILKTSKAHNTRQGITGLLFYGNGMFLQVLEGTRSAVNQLYNRITHDARCRDCQILTCGAIAARKFGDWSMRLSMGSRAQVSQLMGSCGLDSLDSAYLTAGQAADFLSVVATAEREPADLEPAS